MSKLVKKAFLVFSLILGGLPSVWAAAAGNAGGGCGGAKLILCAMVSSLVLLAVGYWVVTFAQSQKKPLSQLGRVIGVVILFSATVMFVLSLMFGWCAIKCPSGGPGCFYAPAGQQQPCH